MPGGHFSDMDIVFHDWLPDVSIAAKIELYEKHNEKNTKNTPTVTKNIDLYSQPDVSDWILN